MAGEKASDESLIFKSTALALVFNVFVYTLSTLLTIPTAFKEARSVSLHEWIFYLTSHAADGLMVSDLFHARDRVAQLHTSHSDHVAFAVRNGCGRKKSNAFRPHHQHLSCQRPQR